MLGSLTAFALWFFACGFLMASGIFYTDKPHEEREHKVWACVQTGDTMECQYTESGFTKRVFFEVKEMKK